MHYLKTVIADVDKTHARLGKAVAFSMICVKARKCQLFVSAAGMGKSTVSNFLASTLEDTMIIDAVSEAGVSAKQDAFRDFAGLVVIDDMGKLGSYYRRVHTLIAMAELAYSHFQKSYMWGNPIDITGFRGSVILNIQPAILNAVIADENWEVVLMDKTIRYYHLYRPLVPIPRPIEVSLDWGVDLDLVATPTCRGKLWRQLERIGQVQWSDARTIEHLTDLLKATAALDQRREVDLGDYRMLLELMRPMYLERYLFDKSNFEYGRSFQNNMLAVMIEVASWQKLTVHRIARDYKLSPKRVGELLSVLGTGVVTANPFTLVISPSDDLKRVLKEGGVE